MKDYNISTVVDDDLKYGRVDYCRGKTYEERYGEEVASRMKEIRRIKATHQMTNFDQIQIRREKCSNYKNPKLRNKRIKAAANKPEVKLKRRQSMTELYKRGYMTSAFSKPAFRYIAEFIKKRNMIEENCYYLRGSKNKEYFTIINGSYYFYDFVSFNENGEVDTVLEVNGPWHYTKQDVLQDPWSRATPYKANKTTKYQSYLKDQLKLKRAKELARSVLVYWLKDERLEVIK